MRRVQRDLRVEVAKNKQTDPVVPSPNSKVPAMQTIPERLSLEIKQSSMVRNSDSWMFKGLKDREFKGNKTKGPTDPKEGGE